MSTSRLRRVYNSFTVFERLIFGLLIIGLVISGFAMGNALQTSVSRVVAAEGGRLVEGVVGYPRYVNPVLATTNADRDLSALVYSGLVKIDEAGQPELDLAEDMSVSEPGLVYTFTIREDAEFHDGHPVRAEDVVFTINMIKDQQIDSPRQADWEGVSVEADGERTVRFILSEEFGGFMYNASIGILPRHVWEDESTESFSFAERNTNPIGSGPYEIVDVQRDAEGIPTEYELASFGNYHEETPLLSRIRMRFFADTGSRNRAFEGGAIESMYGVTPSYAQELSDQGQRVTTHQLRRVFSVFFNQSRNDSLVNTDVRKALALAIPKTEIINTALDGYGSPVSGPTPNITNEEAADNQLDQARELLESAGWQEDGGTRTQDGQTLSITLATADVPSLNETAEIVARQWEEIGVDVTIDSRGVTDLSRNVIRPRQYEALLFGQSISHSDNLYPFWHSSAQDDPGLNLSMYTSVEADDILTDLRQTRTQEGRASLIEDLAALLEADQPAAFIFSPQFIYVVPEDMKDFTVPPIVVPADRFSNVSDWYTNTMRLWNMFAQDENQSETTSTSSATSS